jgi:hypothetical protein
LVPARPPSTHPPEGPPPFLDEKQVQEREMERGEREGEGERERERIRRSDLSL